MNKTLISLPAWLAAGWLTVGLGMDTALAAATNLPPEAPAGPPTAGQEQLMQRGYGMFMHFGINTFNQTEWSDGTLPVSSFNPTNLDCDQWVATAKQAGFRYVVLVTKHHDGFCLWPSAWTEYSVKNAPVQSNIVAGVAAACKKYHMQLGLYYSLWDRHEPTFQEKSLTNYVTYMKRQLRELLTSNGPICEIWFDGAWARPAADWDIPGVYALIKELQPDCQITVNHTIGVGQNVKKIGQPKDFQAGDAIRFFPVDFRTKDPNLARWDDPKDYRWHDQLYYLPFEHTLCLSDRWNWFQKKDVMPARSVDELEELFYWCTAHGNVLLLNVPPDQTGRQRPNERARVLELADRLGIRGGDKPLPRGPVDLALDQTVTATSTAAKSAASDAVDNSLETAWVAGSTNASLEISFAQPATFNRIAIMEEADMKDLGDGFSVERVFRVQRYNIEAYDGTQWRVIHTGKEIGACGVIHFFRRHTAEKLRLNILAATKPPGIYHLSVSDDHTRGIRE